LDCIIALHGCTIVACTKIEKSIALGTVCIVEGAPLVFIFVVNAMQSMSKRPIQCLIPYGEVRRKPKPNQVLALTPLYSKE